VRIVFLHFESNRIVFAVLKSRDVKFVFIFKCKLQLLKFELNSKFVCVLDPEEHEINFVHYFLHPACVMDHPSCTTGPASQRLAMRGCSRAVRCADETACGMCKPERQYHIGSTSITTYFKCSMSLYVLKLNP